MRETSEFEVTFEDENAFVGKLCKMLAVVRPPCLNDDDGIVSCDLLLLYSCQYV